MPRNPAVPTSRTTGSLAYPADPLAAIRELHALDARPVATDPGVVRETEHEPVASATAPPPAPATGSEDGSAVAAVTGSRVGSVVANTVGKRATAPTADRRPHRHSRENGPRSDASNGPGNPLADAVRELLARPYTSDPRRGPYTVSTVKVPTEVWERLGWVAALTGRHKQEILAVALKDHFDKVLREA